MTNPPLLEMWEIAVPTPLRIDSLVQGPFAVQVQAAVAGRSLPISDLSSDDCLEEDYHNCSVLCSVVPTTVVP